MGILDVPDTLCLYIVHNNYYFVVVKCFVEVDKGFMYVRILYTLLSRNTLSKFILHS